jgi:hypothetical protein
MGFFADQRIKNGQKATRGEDKAPMPKNTLNMNPKPDFMKGAEGSDMPVNQGKSSDMDSTQQARSKKQSK